MAKAKAKKTVRKMKAKAKVVMTSPEELLKHEEEVARHVGKYEEWKKLRNKKRK